MSDNPVPIVTFQNMLRSVRDATEHMRELTRQTEKQLTPLMRAAEAGDEAAVLSLLEQGADVNAQTETGQTVLRRAISGNHPAIVSLLVRNGANASTGHMGFTALHSAAILDRASCVEALLDAGANVDAREMEFGQTPLMQALEEGDGDFMGPSVARLLIKRGANVMVRDTQGETVLDRVSDYEAAWSASPDPWLGESQRDLIELVRAAVRDQEDELEEIRRGLEASDAGRVRPLAEAAAEMRAKYSLPTHLSDEGVLSGGEGLPPQ